MPSGKYFRGHGYILLRNSFGKMGKSAYDSSISMEILKYANDQRWRIREGVAQALAEIIFSNHKSILSAMELHRPTPLEMRTFCAGLADPKIYNNINIGKFALRQHEAAISMIQKGIDSREEKRVLAKALSYTISVVMIPVPDLGFRLIKKLLHSGKKDLMHIAKENLLKNRTRKRFPEDVESMEEILKSLNMQTTK